VVADRLGVSLGTLDGLVHDGSLPFVNVGRGKKRPRRMFTETAVEDFIAGRTKREEPPCLSTKVTSRRTSNSRLPSNAIGFMERRSARLAEKQRSSSEGSVRNVPLK
jgi:excisionase family DNA binding protein